jgi:hypothetical protein
VGFRCGDEAADGGSQPPVSGYGREAGEVEEYSDRLAEDIAIWRDHGDGEVPGVEVDCHDWCLPQFV